MELIELDAANTGQESIIGPNQDFPNKSSKFGTCGPTIMGKIKSHSYGVRLRPATETLTRSNWINSKMRSQYLVVPYLTKSTSDSDRGSRST